MATGLIFLDKYKQKEAMLNILKNVTPNHGAAIFKKLPKKMAGYFLSDLYGWTKQLAAMLESDQELAAYVVTRAGDVKDVVERLKRHNLTEAGKILMHSTESVEEKKKILNGLSPPQFKEMFCNNIDDWCKDLATLMEDEGKRNTRNIESNAEKLTLLDPCDAASILALIKNRITSERNHLQRTTSSLILDNMLSNMSAENFREVLRELLNQRGEKFIVDIIDNLKMTKFKSIEEFHCVKPDLFQQVKITAKCLDEQEAEQAIKMLHAKDDKELVEEFFLFQNILGHGHGAEMVKRITKIEAIVEAKDGRARAILQKYITNEELDTLENNEDACDVLKRFQDDRVERLRQYDPDFESTPKSLKTCIQNLKKFRNAVEEEKEDNTSSNDDSEDYFENDQIVKGSVVNYILNQEEFSRDRMGMVRAITGQGQDKTYTVIQITSPCITINDVVDATQGILKVTKVRHVNKPNGRCRTSKENNTVIIHHYYGYKRGDVQYGSLTTVTDYKYTKDSDDGVYTYKVGGQWMKDYKIMNAFLEGEIVRIYHRLSRDHINATIVSPNNNLEKDGRIIENVTLELGYCDSCGAAGKKACEDKCGQWVDTSNGFGCLSGYVKDSSPAQYAKERRRISKRKDI